jgi:polyhydroxyalkanoate synthesis regulator phasin
MAEPGSTTLREVVEKLALAGVGAVALTAERADALADELAKRGGMRRDDARHIIEEQAARWRGEASRVGERAGASLSAVFRELGLVTRDEYSELELRVAQLEHRLRLLEEQPTERLPATRSGRLSPADRR